MSRTLAAVAVLLVASLLWFLEQSDFFWQNPISDARFPQLTDFEGTEQAAAISRDGQFVAFLADRAGPMDAWVTQVGTGQFHNLTRGNVRELDNPDVRTIGFSPDATLVSMWMRRSSTVNPADISVWAVPTLGGEPRPYFEGVAEFDWSADGGRLRLSHTWTGGSTVRERRRRPTGAEALGGCPSASALTRPHPPHSQAHPDFGLIRDAFAVRHRLRRPASGSVLSLRVPSRHAVLYDRGEPIGCSCPVPSPMTLAFAQSQEARHSRVARHALQTGECFRGFAGSLLLRPVELFALLADLTERHARPTRTFTPELSTCVAIACAAFLVLPVAAHHSHNNYDVAKWTTWRERSPKCIG